MKLFNWLHEGILDILENKRCPKCGSRVRLPIYGGWRCSGCDYRVKNQF